MANIPVEKTASGAAWLPWLLGLLALAAIGFVIFLAMDDPDNDDVAAADGTDEVDAVAIADDDADVVATAPDASGALTAATLLAADDISEYVGQDVTFTGLRVMEVLGDQTFTVSPDGSDRMMLVYLEQEPSPDRPGIEGQYDVNAGQMVQIDGTVQRLEADDLSEWGISPTGVSAGDPYVRTSQLDISGAEVDTAEIDDVEVAPAE